MTKTNMSIEPPLRRIGVALATEWLTMHLAMKHIGSFPSTAGHRFEIVFSRTAYSEKHKIWPNGRPVNVVSNSTPTIWLRESLTRWKESGNVFASVCVEKRIIEKYLRIGRDGLIGKILSKSNWMGEVNNDWEREFRSSIMKKFRGQINELTDEAAASLVDAMTLFEELQRTGDLNSALWHLGRIRIKTGDAKGIKDIDRHLSTAAGWHGKANDYVLLGIGYYDLLNDDTVGRQHFASMLRQYPEMDEELKNQTYGVDNALANAIAAIERLSKDTSSEAAHLRIEFGLFRKRLESLRSKTIQSLPFVA